MKKILLALFALTTGFATHAQSAAQCSRALEEAEQAFEEGRLLFITRQDEDAPNLRFHQCLEAGSYSIEEEIRARKLLVKAYLFSDNEEAAEKELVELLKTDKEHQLTPEDPAELFFLYQKYQTEPVIRVSAKMGFNRTLITQLQEFNTSQAVAKEYNPNFTSGTNFWAEILAERHLGKGIEVAMGAQMRYARYDMIGELIENDLTYEASNLSTMLRVPLIFRYNFRYDEKNDENERIKLIPYVFLGSSLDLVIDAKYEDTSRSGGTAVTLSDENSSLSDLDQVAKQNVSIFAGIGSKLRVGRAQVNFLTLEVRYDNSLFNYIDPDHRWDNQRVAFEIGHVEDDLTINTLSFSIGYIYSLYNPKKRKQYR